MKTHFSILVQSPIRWILPALLLLASCKDDDPETLLGESQAIGTGMATAYLINDADGDPLEIGVKMSLATYTSLTDEYESLSLDYPANGNRTPFVHAMFDWAPFGHDPADIYTLPHFDVHFYMTSSAEREAIELGDSLLANILPDAAYFPPDYFPTGIVPQMGNHWIDAKAKELDPAHPNSFDETFIYGSFNGEVTFWEPMITKAFIESENDFEKAVPQPAKYNAPGRFYPRIWGFSKDEKNSEIRFYMRDFVKR